MMRVTRDPLIGMIAADRAALDQIKTAQRMGGDCLLGYTTDTGNINDFSVALAVGGYASYKLTFTPAHTTYAPIVELFAYATYVPNVLATWTFTVSSPVIVTQKVSATVWYFTVYNQDNVNPETVYAKFIFSGTDTGTFTIVPA